MEHDGSIIEPAPCPLILVDVHQPACSGPAHLRRCPSTIRSKSPSTSVRGNIRDKEDKLPEYKRILGDGDVWLLFVTGARFEQNVYTSLVKERNMQSKFDRIFLLDLRDETVVTLK
jgi:hypothetical protein